MSIVQSRWSAVEIDENISITECVLRDAIKHGDKVALVGICSSFNSFLSFFVTRHKFKSKPHL